MRSASTNILYHDPFFISYIVNFSFAKSEEGLQWTDTTNKKCSLHRRLLGGVWMNKTDGHDLTIIFIGCYFVYITHKNVPNISKLFLLLFVCNLPNCP
jgi:hypothetical protein